MTTHNPIRLKTLPLLFFLWLGLWSVLSPIAKDSSTATQQWVSSAISPTTSVIASGSVIDVGTRLAVAQNYTKLTNGKVVEVDAKSVFQYERYKAQLRTEEVTSFFDTNGQVKSSVINMAKKLNNIDLSKSKNTKLINALTKDGSNIKDWDKMALPLPNGKNVHFYYNSVTKKPNFDVDYKTIINDNARRK